MNDSENILKVIQAALDGERGVDQRTIAETALDWVGIILRKNMDYGCAVWDSPVLVPSMEARAAILVRMSDKVSRIAQLVKSGRAEVDESLDDTIKDLGAYCLLYLAGNESKQLGEGSSQQKYLNLVDYVGDVPHLVVQSALHGVKQYCGLDPYKFSKDDWSWDRLRVFWTGLRDCGYQLNASNDEATYQAVNFCIRHSTSAQKEERDEQ